MVEFKRFPHTCTIYSLSEDDSFSDGERVIVWEGVCRKERNTSIRAFKQDEVYKGDYRIQLGQIDPDTGEEYGAIVEGIKSGMFVDCTDCQDTFVKMPISDAYVGNLGTSVYCDKAKN